MDQTVKVWGNDVTVSTYQKSKTVWIASGTYLGKHIQVTDRSRTAAIGAWRKAAEYAGG